MAKYEFNTDNSDTIKGVATKQQLQTIINEMSLLGIAVSTKRRIR